MNRFLAYLVANANRVVRGLCIGLMMIATVSCHGASRDWNGTWKLNPGKSDIPGPTLIVSITPDGMYHNSGGSGTIANFRCDGKEYKATEILTVFCTQGDGSGLEITAFKNGSKVGKSHWELSPDGRVLTIKSTIFHADGPVKIRESRYTRTSGSVGFAGGWKSMNPSEGIPSIRQIRLQGHEVHELLPEKDMRIDATLDGTDTAIHGPFTSPGASISLKEHTPRELTSTMKLYGRVVSIGYWRISADGHSLTESYWVPSRPNEKVVLLYEKQ